MNSFANLINLKIYHRHRMAPQLIINNTPTQEWESDIHGNHFQVALSITIDNNSKKMKWPGAKIRHLGN